jgi:hypothetical protein
VEPEHGSRALVVANQSTKVGLLFDLRFPRGRDARYAPQRALDSCCQQPQPARLRAPASRPRAARGNAQNAAIRMRSAGAHVGRLFGPSRGSRARAARLRSLGRISICRHARCARARVPSSVRRARHRHVSCKRQHACGSAARHQPIALALLKAASLVPGSSALSARTAGRHAWQCSMRCAEELQSDGMAPR